MGNRIIRKNGFIVREQDAVTYMVECGWDREKAEASVARSPEVTGNPLSPGQYANAMNRMNSSIDAMASEPDNGDRFW